MQQYFTVVPLAGVHFLHLDLKAYDSMVVEKIAATSRKVLVRTFPAELQSSEPSWHSSRPGSVEGVRVEAAKLQ